MNDNKENAPTKIGNNMQLHAFFTTFLLNLFFVTSFELTAFFIQSAIHTSMQIDSTDYDHAMFSLNLNLCAVDVL